MSEHWRYDYGWKRARKLNAHSCCISPARLYSSAHDEESYEVGLHSSSIALARFACFIRCGHAVEIGMQPDSQPKMMILTCYTLLAHSNSPSDMRTSLLLLLLSCFNGYSSPVISAVTDWLTLGTFFLFSIYVNVSAQ